MGYLWLFLDRTSLLVEVLYAFLKFESSKSGPNAINIFGINIGVQYSLQP